MANFMTHYLFIRGAIFSSLKIKPLSHLPFGIIPLATWEQAKNQRVGLPTCCPCVDFLALFAPGVNPGTESAGERVARHRQHLSHGRCAQCLGLVALGIIDIIPWPTLHDEERRAEALQFADRGREPLCLLTILVIDIIPRPCGLDITDALRMERHDGKKHQNGNKDFLHRLNNNNYKWATVALCPQR